MVVQDYRHTSNRVMIAMVAILCVSQRSALNDTILASFTCMLFSLPAFYENLRLAVETGSVQKRNDSS